MSCFRYGDDQSRNRDNVWGTKSSHSIRFTEGQIPSNSKPHVITVIKGSGPQCGTIRSCLALFTERNRYNKRHEVMLKVEEANCLDGLGFRVCT